MVLSVIKKTMAQSCDRFFLANTAWQWRIGFSTMACGHFGRCAMSLSNSHGGNCCQPSDQAALTPGFLDFIF